MDTYLPTKYNALVRKEDQGVALEACAWVYAVHEGNNFRCCENVSKSSWV